MISKDFWEKNQPNTNPFLNFNFYQNLLNSGCIGESRGWSPISISNESGFIISFIKTHSYGEYIFDWSWAEAYQKQDIPYYPKLTSMLPFTPVTTQHFMMKEFGKETAHKLLIEYDKFYDSGDFSSSHFLFLKDEEIEVFKKQNYLIRESIQYHFFNPGYEDFSDFLAALKNKKAKNIKKERTTGLIIKQFINEELTEEHARRMYQFYMTTIINKSSYDYLNEEFFLLVFKNMRSNILYVEAYENETPLAGSLFFYDSERLYGRYWGTRAFSDNLHFELCYYQGIDFCIKNGLKIFEAGAQGEHKIARGFRPIKTFSAHKIKNPTFNKAIADFIEVEKSHVQLRIEHLSQLLPFK